MEIKKTIISYRKFRQLNNIPGLFVVQEMQVLPSGHKIQVEKVILSGRLKELSERIMDDFVSGKPLNDAGAFFSLLGIKNVSPQDLRDALLLVSEVRKHNTIYIHPDKESWFASKLPRVYDYLASGGVKLIVGEPPKEQSREMSSQLEQKIHEALRSEQSKKEQDGTQSTAHQTITGTPAVSTPSSIQNQLTAELGKKSRCLYVCRGKIRCETAKHHLVSVKAAIPTVNMGSAEINAFYCQDCDLLFIHLEEYDFFRDRYGLPLITIAPAPAAYNKGDMNLKELSPLRMAGYTVDSQNGLSDHERQQILADIVASGMLSKEAVINYINGFIALNGQKASNHDAVQKWKRDVVFMRSYGFHQQVTIVANRITAYRKDSRTMTIPEIQGTAQQKSRSDNMTSSPVTISASSGKAHVIGDHEGVYTFDTTQIIRAYSFRQMYIPVRVNISQNKTQKTIGIPVLVAERQQIIRIQPSYLSSYPELLNGRFALISNVGELTTVPPEWMLAIRRDRFT